MEHHVEVPEETEQVVAEKVGVGPGRRVLNGIRRPFAAVGRRLIRFLFDRLLMADAVDRRLAVGERLASMAGDLERMKVAISASQATAEAIDQGVASMANRDSVESALEGIRELQVMANDERGRLDSLSADLSEVAATVAARTRTVAPDGPLTSEAKEWIESVSSVWPDAALEAYARARQTLEIDFGRDPELPAPPRAVA